MHIRLRLELFIRECTARCHNEEAHTSDINLGRGQSRKDGEREGLTWTCLLTTSLLLELRLHVEL